MNQLNRQTLERLMHYYHCIEEHYDLQVQCSICSGELARLLRLDDTQIRKDFAAIGVKGHRRIGFDGREVLSAIREILGFNRIYRAVIVGAGRLGGALASYKGFTRDGLEITALFDNDQNKYGLIVSGHTIQPMEQLEPIIRQKNVQLGILTVPTEVAQETADRLIRAGIQALWSFSPINLQIPESIFVRYEYLSVGLAHLSYHLKQKAEKP